MNLLVASLQRNHLLSLSISLLIITILYLASAFIPIGYVTYGLMLPALWVIGITAIARMNDISRDKVGVFWVVRKVGLTLTLLFAVAQTVAPLIGSMQDWPTWRALAGIWGYALVLMTSPFLPPWYHYIWKSGPHTGNGITND